jgi:uracil-DNA glycosylase
MAPLAIDETAAPLIPGGGGVKALREAAAGCRACPLWRTGTQTVFGAGAARAPVMLVGEQPGDQEDRKGLPFVGPA